ncbi:TetR/AcrR family transcriptional regulator [Paenarthrobacter sp. PH39-S1]|uniref:TetR/AcrR family transcriptional regulator n=1 Tax=Paenarthrobacter sp. PH39-S1 TaxID=3046204 RepID=UPI0024B97A7A|nr:TetR/AcrR family transcriptional regulator [Paenarthrobacter sp. PH39-S1]MDJ0356705.1 WHG domain-containing protein [Paenarthrobacter sp. PH39-S1]
MRERLNRAAIVRQAADLADESGLEELTITRIASKVGIAPPGVYRHVVDLDDVRRAIGCSAATDLTGLLGAAASGRSGEDALIAVATTLRTWAQKHPGRYTAVQIAPDPDDLEYVKVSNELINVIGSALRAYNLSGPDLIDAVRLLRSILHGFIALELQGGFKLAQDTGRSFERLIRSVDIVLRSWSATVKAGSS